MASRVNELNEASAHWAGASTAKPWLAYTAVALHAWYCALESAIERVARAIDESVPQGDFSHRELLSQAMTDIPGIRPPVLPAGLTGDLVAVLAFRHFFRHAYAVDLDFAKLRRELDRVLRVHPNVEGALDRFDHVLAAAERTLMG